MRRLLAPRSVALIGGAWADEVERASRVIGYGGHLWRIHPQRPSTPERHYYRSVAELPEAPDASFVAAPAREVPQIAGALAARGAGGFVCFASGFSELGTPLGADLTRELIASAGELPYFGPNCYGFINFFDRVALWPDQVVGTPPARGVALICQSGTLSLNLLFNRRSLPVGYVITVGNQTQVAIEDLIELLCVDARVSAFGLYVEGIKDTGRFARAIDVARAAGKPVAIVKAGRTEAAARTAHSHTGSLAGADAAFDAYCRQAGLARCDTLATLCETLKVLHLGGPLPGRRTLVLGASGGDMAMAADVAGSRSLSFPPIPPQTTASLREILGERVHIANPFDFHTHIWFDRAAMRALFSQVQRAGYDSVGFMLDCPPSAEADPSAYYAAIDEYIAAAQGAPSRTAVISSLPESLEADIRARCIEGGVIPLQGQREALEAIELAGQMGETWAAGARVQLRRPAPSGVRPGRSLPEHEGKAALAAFGVRVPRSAVVPATAAVRTAAGMGFPVVMKATGAKLEHKSEVGGVVVDIRSEAEAQAAAQRLAALADELLVEEMIADGVAEMLVGITVDAQFGQLLVLGAGGVLTELLRDTVTLLPPFSVEAIEAAVARLRMAPLLRGFRGKPPADVRALAEVALACTEYAHRNLDTLLELDLNPVIVRPAGRGAVAVDALVRLA